AGPVAGQGRTPWAARKVAPPEIGRGPAPSPVRSAGCPLVPAGGGPCSTRSRRGAPAVASSRQACALLVVHGRRSLWEGQVHLRPQRRFRHQVNDGGQPLALVEPGDYVTPRHGCDLGQVYRQGSSSRSFMYLDVLGPEQ